jgi:nicotinate (nicotinamide) nucleotide adenylyltransferase
MQFHQRSHASQPRRVGILPGSFNPPTIAHLGLVAAAQTHVDEVVCVLPQVFPHKEYFGASLEQRVELLQAAGWTLPYSIATSERGLFIDIARECREHYGPETKLCFLCGRDAAERIMTWDYGRPGVVGQMLQEFELLVAPRGGQYRPPPELCERIRCLDIRGDVEQVSSTEVRSRIARGEPWEHLVPEPIAERVREIYS